MDIKVPLLHQHYLLCDNYENQDATCDKCHQKINGPAYNCESCNFWLHYSCAEQQLPRQISHPAHSQHLLSLLPSVYYADSVCDICFNLCRGHVYTCGDCKFCVGVLCASNTEGETSEKESQRSDHDRYQDFIHFSHPDPLILSYYRKVGKNEYTCKWCGKFLSGICYGCYSCDPHFVLHQSCLLKIPFRIFQHPFHPSHPLHIQRPKYSSSRCNACNDTFQGTENAYTCPKCDFSLHVICARLQPSLKGHVHDHSLTYIPRTKSFSRRNSFKCNMCQRIISAPERFEKGNFYRCVPCNMNFHFKCVPIPATITHGYHRHVLTFINSFIEDDSIEYYCDICEEERNPEYPIYYCKECTYIAHIHCALNKVDSKALIPTTTWQEETDKKTDDAESQIDHFEHEIEVFFHEHLLCFYEVHEEEKLMSCKACGLKISSQGYACETCAYYNINYHLHKTCAKLPYKMLHPLHPQHSLNLFANIFDNFTCHECRCSDVMGFGAFGYVCYQCNFKLDVKCAANLTTSTDEHQRLKRMKRLSKRCPFNQAHKLEVRVYTYKTWCNLCLIPQTPRDPIFHCKLCYYVIHESCLEQIPWKIQVPIHPAHPLNPKLNPYNSRSWCQVCGASNTLFSHILYSCQNCRNFRLHLPCANSLKRAITIKGSDQSHDHNLFYYGPKWQEFFNMNSLVQRGKFSKCGECGESLDGMASFHCLICEINLHLKCVPIPHSIQSKCHIHPFILKDQHVEDDFGEYYCDVCEEERHPDDHVYFCEQCAFVAHIECVLKQVEETTLGVETYSNLEIEVEKLPYPKLIEETKKQKSNEQ